jgi:N-acyl-L-homoserine lactone synthetase
MQPILHTTAEAVPDAVLRAMFAARKAVFVDLLRWDVPVLAGQYELDQFDDLHANYLILSDPDGAHLGSARLLPTTRPHILDSLFAGLCDEAPPRSPSGFEITRFCLDRSLSARERRAVRNTLIVRLVDHALTNGIATYTAVADMAWFAQIPTFGWACRLLGTPRAFDGKILAAFAIEIDASTPGRLRAAGVVAAPAGQTARAAA